MAQIPRVGRGSRCEFSSNISQFLTNILSLKPGLFRFIHDGRAPTRYEPDNDAAAAMKAPSSAFQGQLRLWQPWQTMAHMVHSEMPTDPSSRLVATSVFRSLLRGSESGSERNTLNAPLLACKAWKSTATSSNALAELLKLCLQLLFSN